MAVDLPDLVSLLEKGQVHSQYQWITLGVKNMFTERLDVTGFEEVYHFTDTDFSAFIAIHNTQLGPALGGCRMKPYESDNQAPRTRAPPPKSAVSGQCHMENFSVGQKWVARDAIFGTFFGEIIEVSDHGTSGIVVITDDPGNVLDTFSGSAAEFQASREWQVAD